MSPIQYQTVNALAGKTIPPIGVPLHVPRRFQRPQQHGFEVCFFFEIIELRN